MKNNRENTDVVVLPRYEYSMLIRSLARLDMIGSIVSRYDAYDCKKYLDAIFHIEPKEGKN